MLKVLWRLVHATQMFAILGAVLGGLALAGLYTFQNSLIYPAALNDGRGYCATPDEMEMPDYEELFLTTEDGVELQCYVLRQDRASAAYTNKTVVILSPNAGNIGHALQIVAIFYKTFGYNVLIYSYRGYGKSSGTPLEAGLKLDAKRVVEYVSREDEQLLQTSLVLYGRSLGGAVAIHMAATYPQAVLGVVLENTFLSIPKTVPHVFPALKYFTMFVHQVWDSERLVPLIPELTPLLLLSARRDEIVPPAHMDRLFLLLKALLKTLHRFEHACHNDTVTYPAYWDIVHRFIREQVNPVGY
ncbi:alpha/beta-hydrolase [Metschnikowia bicuspidata var. bicuspidata NRRL YB-4993]|uniref:Alpha/beta-hydrolase n=1 Tax=Metschnikowia bicuspidata var. bicuspidata NRRL YB-4993 TaxID=869754 RepID=A0A1A0HAS0_9ASCO|nr:alpha/beta-hydrolase [Metschnikowia bicuspidata var. bicuspidata NRRL YB-4993]OBA20977.1 alpha/beta-hydrolase [Metschnikowia bicuspidata var. bicuspidata NRRL YB-4993]